jgi:hypothetical protein
MKKKSKSFLGLGKFVTQRDTKFLIPKKFILTTYRICKVSNVERATDDGRSQQKIYKFYL